MIILCQCGGVAIPEPHSDDELKTPPSFVPGKSLRILFIGNSLTYFNDLPALVAELGKMDETTITYKMLAPGGYSLEDHWNRGDAQKEMQATHYDLVVGQQGPSALPESQVLLKMYAEKYARECAKLKTSWALYMVWPSEARSFDLDNVIFSYSEAAKATSALLLPAGLAWKLAWSTDPQFPLYGSDRFHPSKTGSLLAAITIYAALQQKENLDFIDRTSASWKNEISDEQLEVMKQAALEAIKGE